MVDLDTVWSLWQRGLVPCALMVAFHIANTAILARWTWLSTAFPRLVNDRVLAVFSAIQGATAGLVPLAVTGEMRLQAVAFAAMTAAAQYLRPTPKVVTIQTPDAGKVRVERQDQTVDPNTVKPEVP